MSEDVLSKVNGKRGAETWSQILKAKEPKTQHIGIFNGEDKLLGFASCGRVRGDHYGHDGEIYALNIPAAYHGLGLGKKLMENSMAFLRSQELKKVLLWCSEQNTRALGFFKSLGAKDLGVSQLNDNESVKDIGLSLSHQL